ncbi:MAG: hypothetical protein NWE93_08665 [Candidatus Bathyarchaeota archaeon]|nr:hypothetical protein [Candidatus Bathyarchaeota archaeon]
MTKEHMPTAGSEFKAGVVNEKAYLFKFNLTYEYDPPNWATKASMPTSRDYFALASYQNKLYCIGGRHSSGLSAANEVYEPKTDSWANKAAMPTARSGMEGVLVDGKIYVISGVVKDPKYPNIEGLYVPTKVNEVYDIATDTWSTAAPIPQAASYYASAAVGTKIYIIKGTTQIYDTQTDTWSNGTAPPASLEMTGCATVSGLDSQRIYVLGGRVYLEEDYLQIYDAETDTWSYGTPLPTARFGLATAVLNNKIYAIGGMKGSFYNVIRLDVIEVYDPLKDASAPPLPTQTPKPTSVPPAAQPVGGSLEITIVAVAIAVFAVEVCLGYMIYKRKRNQKAGTEMGRQ